MIDRINRPSFGATSWYFPAMPVRFEIRSGQCGQHQDNQFSRPRIGLLLTHAQSEHGHFDTQQEVIIRETKRDASNAADEKGASIERSRFDVRHVRQEACHYSAKPIGESDDGHKEYALVVAATFQHGVVRQKRQHARMC